MQGMVTVAAIDCDEEANKKLCSKYGVKGFPTIKVDPAFIHLHADAASCAESRWFHPDLLSATSGFSLLACDMQLFPASAQKNPYTGKMDKNPTDYNGMLHSAESIWLA